MLSTTVSTTLPGVSCSGIKNPEGRELSEDHWLSGSVKTHSKRQRRKSPSRKRIGTLPSRSHSRGAAEPHGFGMFFNCAHFFARFKIGHTPRKNRPQGTQPPASSHISCAVAATFTRTLFATRLIIIPKTAFDCKQYLTFAM